MELFTLPTAVKASAVELSEMINLWLPGTTMKYDSNEVVSRLNANRDTVYVHFPPLQSHRGLGIVVANDGMGTITVLWDAGCARLLVEYSVKHLNPNVISRV